MPKKKPIFLKIVLSGGSHSGKTSIAKQYTKSVFENSFQSTIVELFSEKEFVIQGYSVQLQIWDIGGSNKYVSLNIMHNREADAIIVVFDKSSPDYLTDLRAHLKLISAFCTHNPSIFIVANKIDLDPYVSSEEGLEMSHQKGCIYTELTAKSHSDVKFLFDLILNECLRRRKERPKKSK